MVGLDVDDDDEHAAHDARGVLVRDHVAADAAPLVSLPHRLALVGAGLAGQCAAEVGIGRHAHRGTGDLVDALAQHVRRRAASPLAAWAIGEAHDPVAVDVGDGKADRIGDERKLALAIGQRVLRIAQRLDVHEDDRHADDAFTIAHGHVMRAQPGAGALSLQRLAIERARFAGQRAAQHFAALIRGLDLENLPRRAPQDAFGAAPEVRAVGSVHMAIAKLRVEHAGRERKLVEAGPERDEVRLEGLAVVWCPVVHRWSGALAPHVTLSKMAPDSIVISPHPGGDPSP